MTSWERETITDVISRASSQREPLCLFVDVDKERNKSDFIDKTKYVRLVDFVTCVDLGNRHKELNYMN